MSIDASALDNATRLFRCRKTCLEMLNDRGYLIGQDDLEESKDQFIQKFSEEPKRDDLTLLAPKQEDPTDQMFVFYPNEDKVGVKTIKTFAERMKTEGVSRALMVVQANLTPFAKQCLSEMVPKYHIEVFQELELMINITRHVLVPQHEVLDPTEKKTLLDRYKVRDSQLPRIQLSDPVARYYGMQRGQVVRIIRPSETAGRYVTYRLCV